METKIKQKVSQVDECLLTTCRAENGVLKKKKNTTRS